MNEDHADAIVDLCARNCSAAPGAGWRMTGIDPEGVDLRRDGETARLDFPAPACDPRGGARGARRARRDGPAIAPALREL